MSITVFDDNGHGNTYRGKNCKGAKSIFTELEQGWGKRKTEHVSIRWNEKSHHFEAPFQLQELNKIFQTDRAKLEEFLDKTVLPLQPSEHTMGLPKIQQPNLAFVKFEPDNTRSIFWMVEAADKTYCIVVTGESGSGKSVLSCLQAREIGYKILYAHLTGISLKWPPK